MMSTNWVAPGIGAIFCDGEHGRSKIGFRLVQPRGGQDWSTVHIIVIKTNPIQTNCSMSVLHVPEYIIHS